MKQRRFAGTQKKAVQKKQRNWFMRLEVHKAMELLWFQKKPLKAKLDKALQNKIISLKDTIGEAISKMRSDISRPKRKNALTLRTIEE